jgi:hypothetical protein
MKRFLIAGLLAAGLLCTTLSGQKAAAWGGSGVGHVGLNIGLDWGWNWQPNWGCCSNCGAYPVFPPAYGYPAYGGYGYGGYDGYGYGAAVQPSYAAPQPAAAAAQAGFQQAGYYPAYGYGYDYYQAPAYWYGR